LREHRERKQHVRYRERQRKGEGVRERPAILMQLLILAFSFFCLFPFVVIMIQ
jgi:hypothetical protein